MFMMIAGFSLKSRALSSLAFVIFVSASNALRIQAQQINSPTDMVAPVAPLTAEPFSLSQVQLLPGPFYDAMLRDKWYLLSLDADRLLYNFRVNYNLSTSNAVPYGGWEAPGVQVRGHIVGHYLSACSLMYASTGDPQLKARVDYLVSQLARCQSQAVSAGFRQGYLSAFPESYIDTVITNEPVWAPWYTIHKIMAGLLDAYQVTGNQQALTVLTNEANWVGVRLSPLSTAQIQTMLNTEYGGMGEVLASLYAVTGNTNYLALAEDFDQQSLFTPLSQQSDVLDPLHVNTQIPKIIAAAREYEMTGMTNYQTIASFFWQRVTQYRAFAIGTPGDNEFFFPTSTFPQHLSAATAETCNIYNLLKLTRYLFAMNPSAQLMDYYERGLYNHVLASQETNHAMMTYLMSLKPGHFKTYCTPEDSFWCCTGTGMENHSKYGDTIYFHDDNTLYLNLFIASQLSWPEKGLSVRQDTTFPQSSTTKLTFTCTNPVPLTLKIRYPFWAKAGMIVTVNGVAQSFTNTPGSYVPLTRTWQTGDQVQIQLPFTLRTEPLPDGTAPNIVALFDGPILLAGALDNYQMPNSDFALGQTDLLGISDPLTPVIIGDTNSFITNTLPVAGQPLTFQTRNLGEPYDVKLIPFYEIQHQRYSVYWKLLTPAAWQQQATALSLADALNVDSVAPGNTASETTHNVQSSNSNTGTYQGVPWRDASNGGWFSYLVSVSPTLPMTLDCTYWGSDSGGRVFDILVNGQIIATQTLTNNVPGQFFQVQYPIPPTLTAGQNQVTVKFQAHSGMIAGGLFGLQMQDSLTVDQVYIGDTNSESVHSLQYVNSTSGTYNGRNWRDANENLSATGWFSYRLNVVTNLAMTLDCTYWGGDSGLRVFDILVNGQIIATQTLTNNQPGQFFDMRYPIPSTLTSTGTQVTVTFSAHPGNIAGGVFGLQMLSALNPGALQSITLSAQPTQPAAGGAAFQYASVTANFQNLTNLSIVNSPNLALLSSDTSVLTIGANGKIISVHPGTATITANYLGYSASKTITVTSSPSVHPNSTLLHRYHFTSSSRVNGTNVLDSLNPGNPAFYATLQGNATISGQQLVLDGSAGTYVTLPSEIISNYNGVTIEAWASFGNEPAWAYLFAFGNTVSGNGQNGFWFTPHSGFSDYRLILSDQTGQANEYRITQNGYLDGNANQQIVAVLDLDSGYEALYLNGSLVNERNDVPFDQTAIQDVSSYIGKSMYPADPTMTGTVSEFRIYQSRLSASQVAASYALGPNMLLSDLKLNYQSSANNFVVSWPTNASTFGLQTASNLSNPNWQTIALTPQSSGNMYQIILPTTNSAQYFRLSQ